MGHRWLERVRVFRIHEKGYHPVLITSVLASFLTKDQAETFHSKPWFKASTESHGYDGPLHTEIQDVAPISERVMESMISMGLPREDDMFSHGKLPHGCGHAPRTHYNGIRSTGADFITKDRARENIVVWTKTHVDKLIIQNGLDGRLIATGVEVLHPDGTTESVMASKEVIISSGTLCSPAILNRSGVGDTSELTALGIKPLLNLPGVGKNLMDHMVVFMFYETGPGITNDHFIHYGDGPSAALAEWREAKKGFLASYPSGVFAFARLDDGLADSELWNSAPREPGRDPMGLTSRQPHIEFWNTEAYGGPNFTENPSDGQYVFGLVPELFNALSRGTVSLTTTDPRQPPRVDCNYLSNPLDVEVLSEACRFGNEIITKGEGTKTLIKGSWPPHLIHHQNSSREDWVDYVKDNATSCKMQSLRLLLYLYSVMTNVYRLPLRRHLQNGTRR